MLYETSHVSRRQMLARCGSGAGLLGLAALLEQEGLLANSALAATSKIDPLAPKKPHFAAKAKSVIWLFINGGPSHIDTWDYKPQLEKRDGKPLEGLDPQTGFFKNAVGPLMKSPFKFRQYGQCGKWVSDLFPYLSKHVDKMAFIHSGYTKSNNHSPALFMMNCGVPRMGFPCVGSWVTYGLGSESRNLPAFVVMSDPKGRGLPKGHAANWGAGFLPSAYQGTHLRPQGEAIDNLKRPADMNDAQQQASSVCWPGLIVGTWKRTTPKRNWPRGSTASNWPIACSRPRPKRSTSAARASRRTNCTASTTSSVPISPSNV